MKVALIPPINLLGQFDMGFHLLLPHLLQDSKYFRFYESTNGYKILDNGVAEGGDPTRKDLVQMAKAVGANEIVVPDKIGDCNSTIRMARQFERRADNSFTYMGVAQGRTIAEVVKCATALSFLEYITVLGLPRVLCKYIHKDARVNFLEGLHQLYDRQFDAIHILGSSSDPREVVKLSTTNARSMDTSMPFVLAMGGHNIRSAVYREWRRPPDYWDYTPDVGTMQLMEDNVRTFLDWAGSAPVRVD